MLLVKYTNIYYKKIDTREEEQSIAMDVACVKFVMHVYIFCMHLYKNTLRSKLMHITKSGQKEVRNG